MSNEDKLQWNESEETYERISKEEKIETIEEAREYLQKVKENGWNDSGYKLYYAIQTLDRNGIALDDEEGLGKKFGENDRKELLDKAVRNQLSTGHFPKLLEKILENSNNTEAMINDILQKYQKDIKDATTTHDSGSVVVRYEDAKVNKIGPGYEAIAYLINQIPEEKRMSVLEGFSEKDLEELSKQDLMEFMEEQYTITSDDLKKIAKGASIKELEKFSSMVKEARNVVKSKADEEARKKNEAVEKAFEGVSYNGPVADRPEQDGR